MLVTALKAQSDIVLKWELVTEQLRYKETKCTEKDVHTGTEGRKALVAGHNSKSKKTFTCHFCKRPGHFKKDYRKFLATQRKPQRASMAETRSDTKGLVNIHALATASSRAT